MRKGVTTLLALVLATGVFSACDGDPLAKERDEGVFMFTNPSVAFLKIDTVGIPVTAMVKNRYNASTGDAVTGVPCDAKITATKDSTRTPFEAPERFIVKAVSPGTSCLVVSGGGITDTVKLIVSPQAIKIFADAGITVGQTKPLNAEFRNLAGVAVNGLGLSDVVFTSRNPAVVSINSTANTMTGVTPGSTYVVASLGPNRGTVVSDSVLVTVTAGPFGGTAPTSLRSGQLVTLTAGPIPFDADTKVTVNGADVFVVSNTPTTYTFVVPALTGTTANMVISNLGPNQTISSNIVPFTAASVGSTDAFGSPRPITLGTPVAGVVTADDKDDFYSFTLAAPATVTIDLDWIGGGTTGTNDVDVYLLKTTGASAGTQNCGTSAHPEHCTFTLAAGTYIVNVEQYAIPTTLTSQPYILTVK